MISEHPTIFVKLMEERSREVIRVVLGHDLRNRVFTVPDVFTMLKVEEVWKHEDFLRVCVLHGHDLTGFEELIKEDGGSLVV